MPLYPGRCPGLGASAPSGRVGITKNPSKYIIFLKNITYIIYCTAYLYSFRFIFVSLQQILYNIIYVRYV
nr:MAG TPA: hypothetical protein [Caudoviricetes sp.]